jgi:hypothetical protein
MAIPGYSSASGSLGTHAIELKCSNIYQKKLNFVRKKCEINDKATAGYEFANFHF